VRRCASLNPFRYFRLLTPQGPAGPEAARLLRRVCGVLFCLYFAKWSLIGISVMYAELYFKWSAEKASLLITVWGIVQCTAMHGLAFLDRCWARKSEERRARFGCITAWVGLWAGLLGMLCCAGAVVEWPLVVGMAVGAMSMTTYTALTSYAGKLVPQSMLGEVQGLLGTTLDISEILGPPVFGVLLRAIENDPAVWSTWPSSFFLLGVAAVLLAMYFQAGLPLSPDESLLSPLAHAARSSFVQEQHA